MKHIVTSRDGALFVVNSAERSVNADKDFASRKTAAELAEHGDFAPVTDAEVITVEAPAPVVPRSWRESAYVIQGGRQS